MVGEGKILARAALAVLGSMVGGACGASHGHSHAHDHAHPHPHGADEEERGLPALAYLERPDPDVGDPSLAFLRRRVADDPDDFIAWNKLAGRYLDRLREQGDHADLERAEAAVRASLRALPAEANLGALSGLALVEQAAHGFDAAAAHARQWLELRPGDRAARFLLGDALFEGGRYDEAAEVFAGIAADAGDESRTAQALAIRRSKRAWLEGEVDRAREELELALGIARLEPGPGGSTLAWCLWQLGDLAFATGNYGAAEAHQREALDLVPDYARSLASLARVRAARGAREEALELYERAIRLNPHIVQVAAVGDLHRSLGDEDEARRWYRWAERIGLGLDHDHGPDADVSAHLAGDPGHHARDLALFYADHGQRPEVAFRLARDDYAARKTVESADALAWTALMAGDLGAARAASRNALARGTRDARFLYHAGEIARRAGETAEARELLERALAASPAFDVLQADAARRALSELLED